MATKVADVDDRVQRLLGLTAEQFRQVVVLPQGRFRELLVATSTKRQEILESLFGAERIRAIEDVLAKAERTRRDRVQALEQQAELVRRHAAKDALEARGADQLDCCPAADPSDASFDIDLEAEKEALTRDVAAAQIAAGELAEKGQFLRADQLRRPLGERL